MSEPLNDDTEVWYCPNDEWVALDDGGWSSCGALCGPTKFGALPKYFQKELREDAGREGSRDED